MGNEESIFSYKEIGEELTTAELVGKIENDKEIANFENEIAMWDAYTKIGSVEFLGDMTEKGMADLFKKSENIKNIKYELIPEQLVENGVEYKVYRTTKNYNKSSMAQEIDQNEYNCYVDIQKKTGQEYEDLVKTGRMRRFKTTRKEGVENYKGQKNIPNENIKEVPCFDEDNNIIEGSQLYYEAIN